MAKMEKRPSISEVLEKMLLVYSPKYGIANHMSIEEMENQSVKRKGLGILNLANVVPMYRTYVESTSNKYASGCGAAFTKEKSQVKALGEFIERYSAANYNGDHPLTLVYNTYENQSKLGECLDPVELIDFDKNAYSNEHFNIKPYIYDKIISWIEGTNENSGEKVWIPAQKVFLGMPLLKGEDWYLQWLSTGLACGTSFRGALISGIYEVVERDSFMLTWLLRIPGRKIIIDNIENLELKELFHHIIKHLVGDDSLHIYDISKTKGIYTVLTYIRNDNENSFGLITSAASDIDPERALLKSLEELCLTQSYGYSELFKRDDSQKKIQQLEKGEINTLNNHFLYYGTGRNSHEIDFIDNNSYIKLSEMKSCIVLNNDEERFCYINDLFKKRKISIYSVDVTRSEIQECGLSVVKAIIPSYLDLDISHNMRLLENKRLLFYQEKLKSPINCAPHPFP